MKSILLALCLLLYASLAQCQAVNPALTGFWKGVLIDGGIPVRVEFSVAEKDGKSAGFLTIVDMGGVTMALQSVSLKERVVRFEVAPQAFFSGTLNEQGTEIVGVWEQGGAKYPVTLKHANEATVLIRPQEPKPPFPYATEEVSIPSSKDVKLAGMLTLPPGKGPHPAVALITGSGAQDRDESLMGHRPFAVLADHLTRQGIAVLRCDDRGVAHSTGSFAAATTADFADDARAQLAWLRARPEIDKRRIGLVGHSEGGIIAPFVAAQDKDVAFIVLLSGVGVPMKDLLVRQMVDMARLKTTDPKKLARAEAIGREMSALLTEDMDDATLEKRVREKITASMAELTPEERAESGEIESIIAKLLPKLRSPWQRWIVRYDPAPNLRAVKCPVLAINGKKDVQVAWRENLEAISRELAAGGNKRVKIAALANLNHLFQHCETGAIKEYGEIEETMSPEVLTLVSDWIRAQTK